MTISINWGQKIINVPKDELTLVQLNPVEIRSMDLNWFRLELSKLESSVYGQCYPVTHNHNTEVSLGGLTYARVVEMVNGYTVTFEDGQYAVNLVGANSNVGDVVNVNQVSVRASNSAGMTSSPAIEYSSYNNSITLDVDNGFAGTNYPIGTLNKPVNNLADALILCRSRGFNTITLLSNLTISETSNIDNLNFKSDNWWLEIHLLSGVSCLNTNFEQLSVFGVLSGTWNVLINCWTYNISNFCGWLIGGSFIEIELAPYNDISLGQSWFDDLVPMYPAEYSIIKMNDQTSIACTGLDGYYKITELHDGSMGTVGIISGNVLIDNTCTGGSLEVSGVGLCIDHSTSVHVDITGLMSKDTVSEAVWDEDISLHLKNGTTGLSVGIAQFADTITISSSGVSGTDFPIGTSVSPVNNITDASSIANQRGISVFHIDGNFILGSTDNLNEFTLTGDGATFTHAMSSIVLTSGCTTVNTTFKFLHVSGRQNGECNYVECVIGEMLNTHCDYQKCKMEGPIQINNASWTANHKTTLHECYTSDKWYVVDYNNSPLSQVYTNFSGLIKFSNITDSRTNLFVYLDSGKVWLDSSCTAGNITVSGTGDLINDSSITNINTDGLMSKDSVSKAVWDEPISRHLLEGTTGLAIGISEFENIVCLNVSGGSGTMFPLGTHRHPVNNVDDASIIADVRGLTKFKITSQFDFSNPNRTHHSGEFIGVDVNISNFSVNGEVFVGCIFRNCRITGIFGDGSSIEVYDSTIEDVSNVSLTAYNSIFKGIIELTDINHSNFYNCYDGIPGIGVPEIKVNTCISLGIWGWQGGIRLSDIITPDTAISVMIAQGRLFVNDSDTQGNIIVKGLANLVGTTGGTTVDSDGLVTKDTITKAVQQTSWTSVYVDSINGTNGTSFPIGTPGVPCRTFDNALIILNANNLREINFKGSLVATSSLSSLIIRGISSIQNSNFDLNNQLLDTVLFEHCYITGIQNTVEIPRNGWSSSRSLVEYRDCNLFTVINLSGTAVDCQIEGLIKIQPGGWFSSTNTVIEGNYTFFDLQNTTGTTVSMDVNSGWSQFINSVDGCLIELNVKGGEVSLDSSCIGGDYYLEGNGTLYNDSLMTQLENHFIWDEPVEYHQIVGSFGNIFKKIYNTAKNIFVLSA